MNALIDDTVFVTYSFIQNDTPWFIGEVFDRRGSHQSGMVLWVTHRLLVDRLSPYKARSAFP